MIIDNIGEVTSIISRFEVSFTSYSPKGDPSISYTGITDQLICFATTADSPQVRTAMASSQVTLRSDSAVSLVEPEKTLRASKALIAHMQGEAEKKAASASKKDLLADDDAGALAETPVFVTFTTKRHLTESRNLKRE